MTPLVEFPFYRPSMIVQDDGNLLVVRGVGIPAAHARKAAVIVMLFSIGLALLLAYRFAPLRRSYVSDVIMLLGAGFYTLWLLALRRRAANCLLTFDKKRKIMQVQKTQDKRTCYPFEEIQLVWRTRFFLLLSDGQRIPLGIGGNTQAIMRIYEAMGRLLPESRATLRAVGSLMHKRNTRIRAKQKLLDGKRTY